MLVSSLWLFSLFYITLASARAAIFPRTILPRGAGIFYTGVPSASGTGTAVGTAVTDPGPTGTGTSYPTASSYALPAIKKRSPIAPGHYNGPIDKRAFYGTVGTGTAVYPTATVASGSGIFYTGTGYPTASAAPTSPALMKRGPIPFGQQRYYKPVAKRALYPVSGTTGTGTVGTAASTGFPTATGTAASTGFFPTPTASAGLKARGFAGRKML